MNLKISIGSGKGGVTTLSKEDKKKDIKKKIIILDLWLHSVFDYFINYKIIWVKNRVGWAPGFNCATDKYFSLYFIWSQL